MLSFKVQLFSVLKSKLKADSVDLETPEGISVSEFLDLACAQYPTMEPYRRVMRLAVNQTYSEDAHILQDGDEVAIITPVSGG